MPFDNVGPHNIDDAFSEDPVSDDEYDSQYQGSSPVAENSSHAIYFGGRIPQIHCSQSPSQRNYGTFAEPTSATFGTPHYGTVESLPNFSHVIHTLFLPVDISPPRDVLRVPPIYLTGSVFPLTNPEEAQLFEHYVTELAIWLDICDPNQHFQVEVPKRASKCPVLLNAIFALSSRHLSLTSDYDKATSNHYHQQCVNLLIPMMGDPIISSDETVFAVMIVLRVLEEIELLESGAQGLSHLSGIQSFVRNKGASVMQGGLGEAAFWVGLRQEIYVATMAERAIQIDIDACRVDRSISETSDFGWANRAVVHLADVLNFCFDQTGVWTARWDELKGYSERWQAAKPISFTPYYRKEADRSKNEVFPEIRHTHPCHIIGIQHHKLAQILLLIHNPRLPRFGGSRNPAELALKIETMDHLRELCGIGLANRKTAPGMFTACMGIAMCGDRFDERIDQESIIEVLVETERCHARPTATIQKQMKDVWGWRY
ncbi:ARCA-like protein [Diplocarpon rosae]|nr:ARCA-like protein [Diplocarpon rosae]